MTCESRFAVCNKCATPGGPLLAGKDAHVWGPGWWEISARSSRFDYELKTTLKIVYVKKKKKKKRYAKMSFRKDRKSPFIPVLGVWSPIVCTPLTGPLPVEEEEGRLHDHVAGSPANKANTHAEGVKFQSGRSTRFWRFRTRLHPPPHTHTHSHTCNTHTSPHTHTHTPHTHTLTLLHTHPYTLMHTHALTRTMHIPHTNTYIHTNILSPVLSHVPHTPHRFTHILTHISTHSTQTHTFGTSCTRMCLCVWCTLMTTLSHTHTHSSNGTDVTSYINSCVSTSWRLFKISLFTKAPWCQRVHSPECGPLPSS